MQVPAQSAGAGSKQGPAVNPPDDAITLRLHSAVEQAAFVVEVSYRRAACRCLLLQHVCGRAHIKIALQGTEITFIRIPSGLGRLMQHL